MCWGLLSPLPGTCLPPALGAQERRLSASFLARLLFFSSSVFPGKQDIPDGTRVNQEHCSQVRKQNSTTSLKLSSLPSFCPQPPQTLFRNNPVGRPLISLQPIYMESVQQSRQTPHCTRKQKIHLKSVFLSTVPLALVCLLHGSGRTGLLRHSRRPMCHCAETAVCDSSHVPPQATACATTTIHRHYQAVWTFCWSPRKGSWKHSETLLCHPLGFPRLTGCAGLIHTFMFMQTLCYVS